MFPRMLTFLTVLTFVGAPAVARSADKTKEATPTIIVRMDSINNLLEDVKYLAELGGQKDKIDEGLKFVKTTVEDHKIDKAIDFTRPLGMYGTVNPDNPVDSSVVILVPVGDENGLLNLLGNYQMTPEKGDDGVYTVQAALSSRSNLFPLRQQVREKEGRSLPTTPSYCPHGLMFCPKSGLVYSRELKNAYALRLCFV